MTGYPPGSLKPLYFVAESAYGTIPTGALTWAGDTIDYKPTVQLNPDPQYLPGSRSHSEVTYSPYDVGFTARYLDRAGSEWHDLFAAYGYGSASGLADSLGDFTAQVDVYDGTNHNWHFHNGCKIQRADIIATAPGAKLEFELEVFSQWLQIVTHASSKAISGKMQDVTPGADGAAETGATLCWTDASQINIAGGGLATWHPQSWTLSLTNGLMREYGIKTGDDSVDYPVAVALHEGRRPITFDATVISQNQTYANSKLAKEAITALTIPIDDETITLSNGHWATPDLTNYKQEVNTEPIRIMFEDLSIA